MLPFEILLHIGEQSIKAYRALLAIPAFARYYLDKQEKTQEHFTVITTSKYRTEYRLNGTLHRSDGPALIYKNGRKEWYKNGEFYKEEGGDIIYKVGVEIWYRNGIAL